MYLYLRLHSRAGTLAEASASSDEVLSLIRMPGNPSKPYYFPLIDRGVRTDMPLSSFWRAPNISGSWSPGSINRLKGGSWLGLPTGGYAMPDDHVGLAFDQLLYGVPVSAPAMGAYFLRNDALRLSGEPGPADVVSAFRAKFDYPADTDSEFHRLFTEEHPDDVNFAWFEPFDVTERTVMDSQEPQPGTDVA
jgi:hypothetical protein